MFQVTKRVSLLLVGRDGNGKSSTANSILGNKKHFNPTSSSSSAGLKIKQASATVGNDREITVTEIAGLEYPESDYAGNFEETLREIEEIIKRNTEGIDAVVIVLKYGTHFTKEEKDALLMIKSIFGFNVLKEFGVIVMTCGDSFEVDVEEEDNKTFEEWCQAQTGDVKTLFEDCANRCVLFNNRTKDADKMEEQRDKLFSLVELIPYPYKLDKYKAAIKGQTEILVQTKLPQLEIEKNETMGEVWEDLAKIDQKLSLSSCNIVEISTAINNVKKKILHLKEFLQDEDKETGVLKHLFYDISIAEMRLKIAKERLQVVISSGAWDIVFVNGSYFNCKNITETVSIRKCSVDGDGEFSSSSFSEKDVPGCGIDLLEICKTTPESQQVTETLSLSNKLSCDEKVIEVFGKTSKPNGRAEEDEAQDHFKDVEKVAQDQGHSTQPIAMEEVVQPKAVEEVEKPKAVEEVVQPKAVEEVEKPKAVEELEKPKAVEEVEKPKAWEEVVQLKAVEHLVQPKAVEHLVQPKAVEELVQPRAVVAPEVAQDQGHSTQLRDNPQTSTVVDHTGHDKPEDDLINTKITFEAISTILNKYNFTNALCLISKYKQKLTKQEIEAVMKMIRETYDTNRVKNQSILILICDNDNLEVENDQMIKDWCQEITGSNMRLLDLCGKRCVLLNPWTKVEGVLVSQKIRLLDYVADVDIRNARENDRIDTNTVPKVTKSANPEPESWVSWASSWAKKVGIFSQKSES